MKSGPKNKDDFLALLVRRRWWIAVPFIALAAAVGLLTYLLPSVYVSEAFIQVRPRDVPENYVPDLMATNAQQRLVAIEQTVMSRPNLLQIAKQFEARLSELTPLNMDQRLERLRDQINVEFFTQPAPGGPVLTAFRIDYQNRNAVLAKDIAQELTQLFIEQDNQIREDQVQGTAEFLQREFEKAQQEVEDSDRALEALRRTNLNALPEGINANQQELNGLREQMQDNEANFIQATSALSALNQQILETPQTLPMAARPAAPPDPRLVAYEQALNYLETALIQYTENHPEVQRARAAVAARERELPEAPAGDAEAEAQAGPPLNPAYSRLRAEIQEVQDNLEFYRNRREFFAGEQRRVNASIQQALAVDPEFQEAYRRSADARSDYDRLRQDLQEATLAETLEFQQQGENFRIIGPANVPLDPVKPNKLAVLFGGLLACLASSVAFAVVVDVARQKMWTQSEIESQWGVPVLIDIPEIVTDSDQAQLRNRRLALAASFAGAAAAYTSCLYLVYLKQDFVIRQLDPLIQGLIY